MWVIHNGRKYRVTRTLLFDKVKPSSRGDEDNEVDWADRLIQPGTETQLDTDLTIEEQVILGRVQSKRLRMYEKGKLTPIYPSWAAVHAAAERFLAQ